MATMRISFVSDTIYRFGDNETWQHCLRIWFEDHDIEKINNWCDQTSLGDTSHGYRFTIIKLDSGTRTFDSSIKMK